MMDIVELFVGKPLDQTEELGCLKDDQRHQAVMVVTGFRNSRMLTSKRPAAVAANQVFRSHS